MGEPNCPNCMGERGRGRVLQRGARACKAGIRSRAIAGSGGRNLAITGAAARRGRGRGAARRTTQRRRGAGSGERRTGSYESAKYCTGRAAISWRGNGCMREPQATSPMRRPNWARQLPPNDQRRRNRLAGEMFNWQPKLSRPGKDANDNQTCPFADESSSDACSDSTPDSLKKNTCPRLRTAVG